MTCIVGIADGTSVWLGGDACSGHTSQWVRQRVREPKVFVRSVPATPGVAEPMLFGYTTSFRMGQLLQHALVIPEAPGGPVDLWLCTAFVDALRKTFKDAGYAKVENAQEAGGNFFVGFRGHLYEIHSDFQVTAHAAQEAAIGCGWEFALGSLATTRALAAIDPERRIAMALQAAAEYSAYVMEPFTTIRIPAA